MLALVQSLAPVANADAKVLILGSMPGTASLQQQQYYAHSRNAFWPIMASLYGFAADLPYALRIQLLTAQGVALWDVLANCEREGSLDSAIRNEQANDFDSFFTTHPHIQLLAFNGGKALQSFQKHVKPHLVRRLPRLLALPSTSPAYAAMPFGQKLQLWRQITGNLSL